ncbi:MAG TPA: NUDIX hydrolase [Vicinamibacterales bacterium]|nr:NUDIX hydrolase [Vicinamibacterales bacterium]
MRDAHRPARAFPDRPIVGVGAVVIDDGRVLLVLRGQPPMQGQWSLPGGAVEVGETLAAAVQREVLEETGLVVSVGAMVEVLDRIHTDADGRVEYHYVLIDYLCVVVDGRLRPDSDAADARWARPDELDAYDLHPVTRAVVDRAFALVPPRPGPGG